MFLQAACVNIFRKSKLLVKKQQCTKTKPQNLFRLNESYFTLRSEIRLRKVILISTFIALSSITIKSFQ